MLRKLSQADLFLLQRYLFRVRKAAIDSTKECPTIEDLAAAFESENGMSHTEWLRRWRANEFPDTFENNYILAHAISLS